MYFIPFLISTTFYLFVNVVATSSAGQPSCVPYYSTFQSPSDASQAFFTPMDTPTSSYGWKSPGLLTLDLDRPAGTIKTSNGVNSRIADGATLNATALNLYGKYWFQVAAPKVAGIVTAIVIIAPEGDEIDVEILGGDPHYWQSNVFVPHPTNKKPLYGVFSGRHRYKSSPKRLGTTPFDTVDAYHVYSVDWNSERIIWGVDGVDVRTLRKEDTIRNGVYHFPSHPAHIQLGIWDASSPSGTAAWAKGPVDWKSAPSSMSAMVKSIRIGC